MQELIVFHGSKDRVSQWFSRPIVLKEVFVLETCQRFLMVGLKPHDFSLLETPENWEIYFGHEAYGFLLEFICGLKSALVGETEVFSQFRQAYEEQKEKLFHLRRLFDWLIADGKEVRSLYLQNLSNLGYGSLIRRVLQKRYKEITLSKMDILLVGSGQIAFSVAPYLADFALPYGGNLYLYNRTKERLENLVQYLKKLKKTNIQSVDEFHSYVKSATVVVLAVPYQESWAFQIENAFVESLDFSRFLLRLSGEEKENAFSRIPKELTMSLTELLTQKSEKEQERENKILLAKRYCTQKARLRFLGNYAHGWEDLSYFQMAI